MPRYRENALIIKCSMLCPGISQNTKHHHLTLYKGQVWKEKPYLELCDHNVLSILEYSNANFNSKLMQLAARDGEIFKRRWPVVSNGELNELPVPGYGFVNNLDTKGQIAWDSEILESFAELTNITNIHFLYFDMLQSGVKTRGIIPRSSIIVEQ